MSMATLEAAPETKSRKRPAARATARPVASKTKVTLCLDADAATRLAVHAACLGVDRSELVTQLVRDHLKRFRVQDLSPANARDNGEDRQASPAA